LPLPLLNGNQDDVNVCNEQFSSVFQTNTVNSDCVYEAVFLKLMTLLIRRLTRLESILIYVDSVFIGKMKLNKSPGFDNVSTEHLLYGEDELYVHLCYVPEIFA